MIKGDRMFEIMLSVMIIGLCLLLAMFESVSLEEKILNPNLWLFYYIFSAICLGIGVFTLVMNIWGYVKDCRRKHV